MAKMSTVAKANYTTIEAAGREVKLSNPDKVFFPKPGFTKLDLAEYYLSVEDATVNQLRERPGTMKRFVDGIAGEFFFQKRVPKGAPAWLQTATDPSSLTGRVEALVAHPLTIGRGLIRRVVGR